MCCNGREVRAGVAWCVYGHKIKKLMSTFFSCRFVAKSCQFVRKIMSVCGKNQVGLMEKSCRFVGKICRTENLNEKYPHMHLKKIPDYLRLFAEVLPLTTSI